MSISVRGNRRGVRLASAVIAAGAALTLTACGGQAEPPYVATFTDKHGRVCTAVVTVEGDDGSREFDVTQPDCEYPPQGRTPGPDFTQSLPGVTDD
ncbi:hypothetical protein AB0M97_01155 [Streptomyces sp. NPDC051207]|uniref:hypothetical protein n=1 Tax=Streptomyces sp. NPDC051207 TaxID=3154641 RepID=UPI003417A79E